MKTFIIARDVYTRGMGPSEITLELRKAESLLDLLVELGQIGWEDNDEEKLIKGMSEAELADHFDNYNGDGADFFIIKELVNGDMLVDLVGGAL